MKVTTTLFFSLFLIPWALATDPKTAYQMAKQGKAVLVDVREMNELKDGMIDQAMWFPMSKLKGEDGWQEEFLEETKGKKAFLYCRSGGRSGKAQEILKARGIQAENIGGYEELKEILPITTPQTEN